MVVEDAPIQLAPRNRRKPSRLQEVNIIRKNNKPRKYVSKHFNDRSLISQNTTKDEGEVAESALVNARHTSLKRKRTSNSRVNLDEHSAGSEAYNEAATPLLTCGNLNIDGLSSDSDLTDVPDDIGPNPFFSDDDLPPPTVLRAQNARQLVYERSSDFKAGTNIKARSKSNPKQKQRKKQKSTTISPYFPEQPRHAHRTTFLTTLPFPPISDAHFGLMQEKLAYDPYRLLLATIFLNKTPGRRAMPIFYQLMDRYPTPIALAEAHVPDVTKIIRELGFQNQRARKCVELAKVWACNPPCFDKRYRKLNYPVKGDGRDVKDDETVSDADTRVAWEISHLPGLGPYSHDSWRMFCRDRLRGQASDWLGRDAKDPASFEPEWKRVLPTDKELRAWMTWMWLKEGWVWNKETGDKSRADDELMRLARGGGIVQEDKEKDHLLVKPLDKDKSRNSQPIVEHPAGDFVVT